MIKSVVYEESLYPEAFAIFEENGCLTLGSNINKKKAGAVFGYERRDKNAA